MTARKGNLNALKHGLYAKRFTEVDRTGLRRMAPASLLYEIAALRVRIDRVLHELENDSLSIGDLSKLTNTLASAMVRLSSLARQHAFLNGLDDSSRAELDQALAALGLAPREKK